MTLDIKRILVPLDFSDNSLHALDYAHGLALKFGAALHLVHVCEVPSLATASMDAYAIAYADWSNRLGEEAERELNRIKSSLADLTVTTEVMFGRPAGAIADAAGTNHADMIVMGTHGHGAVMHMLMGNVAERVVRGAPCPVVTVRAKTAKAPVKAPSAMSGVVASLVGVCLMLAPAFSTSAQAQQPSAQVTPGSALFQTYCASCHGSTARGDGPLASAMNRKPANLTEIAKRNGGEFPSDLVFRTIDGRQPVRGHGGPDMPVWGDAFSRSREAGDADRVKNVIQSLVDYLGSIQIRPAHDQQ